MAAEIGFMLPKVTTKDCPQPPETGRGKERFSPGAFRESVEQS